MKKNLLIVLITFFYFIFSATVSAQYGQYQGPSQSFTILIDKQVINPINTRSGKTDPEYVDNLSPSDPRFTPGQDVWFRLKVKNTSNVTLFNVTVKDFVPSFIDPIDGPGAFDTSNRTITFNAGDFSPDQEKVYFLKMRVQGQGQLPSDKGLFCLVNRSQAFNDRTSDDDTSQFCVEKQVTGVAKTPSAGPEMGIILVSGELIMLGAGLLLNRSKKS